MPAGMFRTAIILGSICVTGPFAIDMYLPALPAIEEALDVSVSAAQITLVAYFLAYGVSQVFELNDAIFDNVDEVVFTASGGTDVTTDSGAGTHFALDDLIYA